MFKQRCSGYRLSDHRIADLLFDIAFSYILEIKLVELGEPAVPAPHCEMAASDKEVMGSGCMAVSAFCCRFKAPYIITGYGSSECSSLFDLMDAGDEDPCCAAVRTDHLCLLGHHFDHLIGICMTMVAICLIFGIDESGLHKRGLRRTRRKKYAS